MDPQDLRYTPSQVHVGGFTQPVVTSNFLEQLLETYEAQGEEEAKQLLAEEIANAVKEKVSHAILEVLARIIDARAPRYEADVLALACGLRLRDGWRPATLAKMYGVSRTTACKDVEAACVYFGLPINNILRGDREENRLSNHRNHARKL